MPAIKRTSLIIPFILLPVLSSAQDPLIKLSRQFKRDIPVQLFQGNEANVNVKGEAALECYRGIKLSEVYYFSSDIKLRYLDNGIEVSDENGIITYGLAETRCKPRYDNSFVGLNGKFYRGFIKAEYEDSPAGIAVINIVDIEDYLKGVLPGEIGDRTPDEYQAVKAQAVAARTYAVWKLTDRQASGKLAPTVADQLYTGIGSEKELLTRGIEETEGEIMVYKDRPISAYYHAVCGGYTAPVEKVWPEKHSEPFLEGVDDEGFCSWAKSYSWEETFTPEILKEAFEKYFVGKGTAKVGDFDDIRDIDFIVDHSTGRMDKMKITTSTGVFEEIDDRMRWALGRPSSPGAILPSTNFKAEREYQNDKITSLIIKGTGNGHGVGMCQCGAIGRSRVGQGYDDILKCYFKHVKLAKLY
jgi:stage II sporulation protein D